MEEFVIDTVDNRGKNPPYYCESGIPIIDNFMIKNNGYPDLKNATRYLDNYLFNNFIRKYNEIDDVLITLVGNGIGNIALFPKEKSAIIQNTIGLRFKDNKKFMYYTLLSKNGMILKLDRGMAQPSIRQDELKDIDINIPIVKEQDKIAKLMTNIDNLITLHQRKSLINLYSWEQRKFENIYNYERPDKYIVNSTEYLEFGPTPVLTANKAFILGYTTENNKYVNSNESIIFDDFTLDTKFVDFPYMVKSSAIKILTLKDEKKDNIRFNFELLSNHRFNMLGHARHYISVVQPEEVFTTNKHEQDKIGELFTNLDNLITLHQRKKNREGND